MRDADVRTALHGRLQAEHADDLKNTLILDEVGLCGEVRVDVAVINGVLSGFELKSAKDSLRRLPKQVEIYSQVLDYAVLVVAENHLKKATQLLPEWWGILVATQDEGCTRLHDERKCVLNEELDPVSLAQLLWRDEALEELMRRGQDRGVRTKPRWEVWSRLSQALEVGELRDVVRARLKERQSWQDRRARLQDGATSTTLST